MSSKYWLGFPESKEAEDVIFINPEEVAEHISNSEWKDRFQLIDVRRTDVDDHVIRGSVNLPAHSLYPTRHAVAQLLAAKASASPTKTVEAIFFCQSCKPGGSRGTRSAGWVQSAVKDLGLDKQVSVKAMQGGIKAFAALYADDNTFMEKLPAELKESA